MQHLVLANRHRLQIEWWCSPDTNSGIVSDGEVLQVSGQTSLYVLMQAATPKFDFLKKTCALALLV
jgi:hypothetical protein